MLRALVPLLGIVIGVAGLAIDFWIIAGAGGGASAIHPDGRSAVGTFVYFWTFFTHVTNLLLVLVYLSSLTRWRWLGWIGNPVGRASMAGNITLVMLFFHFMLAPHYTFTGGLLVANYMLHYVAPILYLAWWLALSPHGSLRLAEVPAMLVIGIVYLAVVLVRGAIVSEYPYDIIDVGKAGYGGVAVGVLILLALVASFCVLLVLVDGLLGRRSGKVAARP